MSFVCRLFGHAAMPAHYHNQGLDFSICARCATDLIRTSGEDEWRVVPGGTRVVWRANARAARATDVASRIGAPPPPRRHPLQLRPARLPHPGPYHEHRVRSNAELIHLCGRLMLSSVADYCSSCWRGPAEPVRSHIIYLPALRARKAGKRHSPPQNVRAREDERWRLH